MRSFMGWKQVPEFESSSSSLDDNSFAVTTTQPTTKVSVKLPSDELLCRRIKKLNINVTEGYPLSTFDFLDLWPC